MEAGGHRARAQGGGQSSGGSPGESGSSCEGRAGQGSQEVGLQRERHVGADVALSKLGADITTSSCAVRIA